MDLLVAFENDPAGHNMAKYLSQKWKKTEMYIIAKTLI